MDERKLEAIRREEQRVKRRVVTDFKVGDKIWVKTSVFKGRTNRTQPIWQGPFVVAEVSDTSLRIKKRNRTTLINKCDCKLFIAE